MTLLPLSKPPKIWHHYFITIDGFVYACNEASFRGPTCGKDINEATSITLDLIIPTEFHDIRSMHFITPLTDTTTMSPSEQEGLYHYTKSG